jgi:hypothetical protein
VFTARYRVGLYITHVTLGLEEFKLLGSVKADDASISYSVDNYQYLTNFSNITHVASILICHVSILKFKA